MLQLSLADARPRFSRFAPSRGSVPTICSQVVSAATAGCLDSYVRML